jgi:hypothetical protein
MTFPKPNTPRSSKITVRIKDVYGRQTAYPVCDKAKLFAKLAGTTSLTHDARQIILALGYDIELEPQRLEQAA